MAGLTAVGIRKDMGLFPGWMPLCYSKSKQNPWGLRAATRTLSIRNQSKLQSMKTKCTITGLGDELFVLFGQEKSRIWLFKRIPEGVTIPLPNGLFRELKQKVKRKLVWVYQRYQSTRNCHWDLLKQHAIAAQIKQYVPHDWHNVVIWAHDHDLGSCRTLLQCKWWSVMANREGLSVIDHLAE